MPVTCIQESFFSAAVQAGRHVAIYLLNGTRVSGKVQCYDKYSVVLEDGEQQQLIFKHSISTAFLCSKAECRECAPEIPAPSFVGQAVD
ncbi:MAG TPA: RNA chaperone Hfq [Candidatus Angelobacter sp.]|nr:RNA chaperone Hfq [Candidatus Angelobacter sp.]